MKPRVLKTYKILAVALTATAGCAPTSGASPEPARTESVAAVEIPASSNAQAQAPREAAPDVAPPASATAEAPPAVARPEPSEPKDPRTSALREELNSTPRDNILANGARFKPLCDRDGYPLVGNLHRKGPPQGFDPSAFCAEVRAGHVK